MVSMVLPLSPWSQISLRKTRGQQHENERLHEADEQLHEVERQRRQEGQLLGHQIHQLLKRLLAAVDVAVKTEGQGHRADRDGDDLQSTPTNRKIGTINTSMKPWKLPFGAKMWARKPLMPFSVIAQ